MSLLLESLHCSNINGSGSHGLIVEFLNKFEMVNPSSLSYPATKAQALALSKSDANPVVSAGGDPQMPDGKKVTAEY